MTIYTYQADVEIIVEGFVEANSIEQAEELAKAHALKNYPSGYIANISIDCEGEKNE